MSDSPSKGELMRHCVKPRSLYMRVNVWDGPRTTALSVSLFGEDDFDDVLRDLKVVARETPHDNNPKRHAENLASVLENLWPLRGYTISVHHQDVDAIVELEREPAERV